MKWQRDIGSYLSWQIARSEQKTKYLSGNITSENKLNTNQQIAELYAYYGIGFYPNNRTLLNATLSIDALNRKYKSGLKSNEVSLQPSFYFSTDYFISYRTRLSANVYVQYSYGHSTASTLFSTVNTFHTGFSVGLSHYFL